MGALFSKIRTHLALAFFMATSAHAFLSANCDPKKADCSNEWVNKGSLHGYCVGRFVLNSEGMELTINQIRSADSRLNLSRVRIEGAGPQLRYLQTDHQEARIDEVFYKGGCLSGVCHDDRGMVGSVAGQVSGLNPFTNEIFVDIPGRRLKTRPENFQVTQLNRDYADFRRISNSVSAPPLDGSGYKKYCPNSIDYLFAGIMRIEAKWISYIDSESGKTERYVMTGALEQTEIRSTLYNPEKRIYEEHITRIGPLTIFTQKPNSRIPQETGHKGRFKFVFYIPKGKSGPTIKTQSLAAAAEG